MTHKRKLAIGILLLGLISLAHSEPSEARYADPRAKEFLKKVLELARHDDLSDVALIERTLGLELKQLSEHLADREKYPNAKWHKHLFYLVEAAAFPLRKSAMERALAGAGKTSNLGIWTLDAETSANMSLFLAQEESGACLSENDMVEAFGPKPRRETSSLHSHDSVYKYELVAAKQTTVLLKFPRGNPCLDELGFLRNFPFPSK